MYKELKTVKSDLLSSVLANGKIKVGRRRSYKFDEDVIFELRQLKEKLVSTRSKLTDLGRKASNLFQVGFGAFKRKSRSKNRTNTVLQNVRLCVPLREQQKLSKRSHLD